METVRKYISKNAYVNRLQGFLPYVENGEVVFPNVYSPDGNYGQMVCDFSLVSASEIGATDEEKKYFAKYFFERESDGKIYYRYRYVNILSDYLYILKELRNGLILKQVKKKDGIFWTPDFKDELKKYQFTPYSFSDLKKTDKNLYQPNEDVKINDAFIILVKDAEKIREIDKKWKTWFSQYDSSYSNLSEKDTLWLFMKEMDETYIGVLEIPLDITGLNVPSEIKYTDVNEWLKWFTDHEEMLDDCCVKKEWDEHGGDKMREFLTSSEVTKKMKDAVSKIRSMEDKFAKPYISFNITINGTVRDNGLMTIYEDEWYTPKVDNSIKPHWVDLKEKGLSDKIESKLDLVRRGYTYDDDGLLPGYLEPNSAGTVYNLNMIKYKGTVKYTVEEDGKDVEKEVSEERTFLMGIAKSGASMKPTSSLSDAKGNKYVNKTIIEEAAVDYYGGNTSRIAINESSSIKSSAVTVTKVSSQNIGNVRPAYLPKTGSISWYDTTIEGNLLYTKLEIPYIIGKQNNVSEGYGDFVTNISRNGNSITIDYNIGGSIKGSSKHGYALSETYEFDPNDSYTVTFDGKSYTIPYEHIKTDYITVHSDDLGLDRDVSQADLNGLWVDDMSGITKSILFKRGVNNGLNIITKNEVDLEIDRGNAAAFEHYYKLSECNTMEDLENYGNNYFNI